MDGFKDFWGNPINPLFPSSSTPIQSAATPEGFYDRNDDAQEVTPESTAALSMPPESTTFRRGHPTESLIESARASINQGVHILGRPYNVPTTQAPSNSGPWVQLNGRWMQLEEMDDYFSTVAEGSRGEDTDLRESALPGESLSSNDSGLDPDEGRQDTLDNIISNLANDIYVGRSETASFAGALTPPSIINPERAISTPTNNHRAPYHQQGLFAKQSTFSSIPVAPAQGENKNMHLTHLNTENATNNAQASPQVQSLLSTNADSVRPQSDGDGVAASAIPSARSGPTPVVVFSDLVVSNASMGLPWYILVVPFATEPTHNLNNLKSSHKTLTGYPACAVPVPSGLTITEYISRYPNHLIHEGLDCCLQRHLAARQIFARLAPNAKDLLFTTGIIKQRDSHNIFQRRLDERIAKLGKDGVAALKSLPWLRDDPTNEVGVAQPFNLNPAAPFRPTKEDRDRKRKLKMEDQEDAVQGGAQSKELEPPEKRRTAHQNVIRDVESTQPVQYDTADPATHGDVQAAHNATPDDLSTRFIGRFNANVSAFICLEEPLGCFWSLPFWDDEDQARDTTHGFKDRFVILWDSASLLVENDDYFANRSVTAKCRITLDMLEVDDEVTSGFEERLYAAEQQTPDTGDPDREHLLLARAMEGVFDEYVSFLFGKGTYDYLVTTFGKQLNDMDASHFDYAVLCECRQESIEEIGILLRRLSDTFPQDLQIIKEQELANTTRSILQ